MKKILAMTILVGGVAVACGAPSSTRGAPAEGERSETNEGTGDIVAMAASPSTTDAVGVVRWGGSQDGPSSTIHGYDADDQVVATVRHEVTVPGAKTTRVDVSVKAGAEAAALTMTFERGEADEDGNYEIAQTITSNTFEEGSAAEEVLLALDRDHQDGDASWKEPARAKDLGAGGVELGTRALEPRSNKSLLSCVNVSFDCVGAAGKALYRGAKAAKGCYLVAKNARFIYKCAKIGAKVGVALEGVGAAPGAVLAGGACALAKLPSTIKNGKACVEGAIDAVEKGAEAKTKCTKDTPECKKGSSS